jgi:hypothetical protein
VAGSRLLDFILHLRNQTLASEMNWWKFEKYFASQSCEVQLLEFSCTGTFVYFLEIFYGVSETRQEKVGSIFCSFPNTRIISSFFLSISITAPSAGRLSVRGLEQTTKMSPRVQVCDLNLQL